MSAVAEQRWVHPSVLAEHFGVCEKTIMRLVRRGEFPAGATAKLGTAVRVEFNACAAHLAQK